MQPVSHEGERERLWSWLRGVSGVGVICGTQQLRMLWIAGLGSSKTNGRYVAY